MDRDSILAEITALQLETADLLREQILRPAPNDSTGHKRLILVDEQIAALRKLLPAQAQ